MKNIMKQIVSVLIFLTVTLVVSSGRIKPRMVNGTITGEHEFPYMVSVRTQANSVWHFCGASVIDVHWILTAGHCVTDPADKKAYALYVGTNLLSETNGPNGISYENDKVILHPDFRQTQSMIMNDLALLHISKEIQLNEKVATIPLGSIKDDVEGVPLIAAGWGRLGWRSTLDQNNLRSINMYTIRTGVCEAMHAKRGDLVNGEMQICVYSPGKTVCTGDSGGPLVDVKTGRLVGVFSSMQLCESEFPVMYTRVSHYIDWIREVTKLPLPLE